MGKQICLWMAIFSVTTTLVCSCENLDDSTDEGMDPDALDVRGGSEEGLLGTYFNTKNLTSKVLERVDPTINFSWGTGSPHSKIDKNTFSVRWTGFLKPKYTETYTFYTVADDGIRFWIDNKLLVNDWSNHETRERKGTISLQAGKSYPVKVEYYDNSGNAVAKLLWSSSSQAKQVIPREQLATQMVEDLCPSDPNKTEPGDCGCGIPEGACDNGGGDTDPLCSIANESKTITLSCPTGETISSIAFASYGLPSGSCDFGFEEGSCHATSSESTVKAACIEKQSCTVAANNGTFGDPCPGKGKKLAVVYSCSGDNGSGDGDSDQCPSDPNKTEPGDCGCGVPEGICNECTDTLLAPNKLLPGEHICSQNGKYKFGMPSSGELSLWSDSKKLWSAGMFGANAHAIMQGDGNLVVYRLSKAMWSSRTSNSAGAFLKLENDGRAVIRLGSREIWSVGGDNETIDNCPNDPMKTEPGECGCGVPEGTCNNDGTITHIATTVVYDPNGQNLTIARPSGLKAGDLLVLVLHRTDDDLPVFVDGWKRVAECYKSDNAQECRTADMCAAWHNDDFCQYYGTDKWLNGQGEWVRYNGHDLAQAVFFKEAGSNEPGSYRFNLNTDSSGHPGWAILTALRGADTSAPVRDWAFKGCDKSSDSVFPSVYGEKDDMLLLSQSFDDAVAQSKFGAPAGTTTFGYVDGERKYVSQADQNTNLVNDETGFLFGGILKSSGETGTRTTIGDGASNCKDVLISLSIKPR